MSVQDSFRQIPSVSRLLEHPAAEPLLAARGRAPVVAAIRRVLDDCRNALEHDPGPLDASVLAPDVLLAAAERCLEERDRPGLRRAVNATGVVLHTALGRAVLAEEAMDAIREEASTYTMLAMSPETGGRARRERHVADLLVELTGAEAATVVNNNAAATLITLRALAEGREAIVSRGQLVEIGGSFRLPDVMDQSGARMVEVGSTNRTYARDFEAAINDETALLVRVHTSNYKIVGFACEPSIEELVALGREHGVTVMDDLGAGALVDLGPLGFDDEPTIGSSVAAGADVITCSADKLIGGPQGGLVLGRREIVDRVRRHPLFRSMRVGKLDLVALEATLRLFREPERLAERHPTMRMLSLGPDDLEPRARELAGSIASALDGVATVAVEPGRSMVGSGSVPVETMPTWIVGVDVAGVAPGELSRRLRGLERPVIARVQRDRVRFDVRTIQPGEETLVVEGLRAATRDAKEV